MDNEVQVQNTTGKNSGAVAGTDKAGMLGARDHNRAGECRERTCAFADIVSTEFGAEQNHAILKREKFEVITGRICGAEEKILGTAPMGAGILLPNGGSGDRGNDQGVY